MVTCVVVVVVCEQMYISPHGEDEQRARQSATLNKLGSIFFDLRLLLLLLLLLESLELLLVFLGLPSPRCHRPCRLPAPTGRGVHGSRLVHDAPLFRNPA